LKQRQCLNALKCIFGSVLDTRHCLVFSISPAIFWRQQIGWSDCAGSGRFGLMA